LPHCMTAETARSILCSIRDSGRCWNDPGFGCTNHSRASRSGHPEVPDGSTDTLKVPVNRQLLRCWPAIHSQQPNRRVWCANLCCAFKREHGHGSVSIRIDQKVGAKGQFFGRFNYDNLTGPTTNPDQTLLDPSFGVQYADRQRNGSSLTRAPRHRAFSGRHR